MKFVQILSFVHLIFSYQLGHRAIDEQLWPQSCSSYLQASSSYLQALGAPVFQNLQDLQPFEFPLIGFGP